ncbi:hypothetical protein BD770DRAFT_376012 [Pilaira anomala]|nr:hypothetical protein BD770DRAFT_376012 [Pilaira anomala]
MVPNLGLRQVYTRDFALAKFPSNYNPTTESMKVFIKSPMQSPVRNLLYRLIHNKVASKDNISYIINLPDDRCIYCSLKQTTMYMLFICHTNQDVWRNFLNHLK